MKGQCDVLVQIDISKFNEEQREKLFQAEQLLYDIGITFDTGTDFKTRDWEWDWSLKGPVKVYFKKMKEEEIIDAICGTEKETGT